MFRFRLVYGLLSLGLTVYLALHTPLSLLYGHFHATDDMRQEAERGNEARVALAKQYLREMETSKESPLFASESDLDLVVTIVSVARQRHSNASYLLQTATSVHKALIQDTSFPNRRLFICNVDETPANNVDAVLLQNKLHFINKATLLNNMGVRSLDVPKLIKSGLEDDARKKEIVDYVFCLNATLSLRPKFVLALEDDVLPTPDLFRTLHHTITHRLKKLRHLNTNNNEANKQAPSWSFLKLYYPQRWQGFELDTRTFVELLAVFCMGACIGGMLGNASPFRLKISCRQSHRTHFTSYRNKSTTGCAFLINGIMALLCVYLIGRVNFMEFRRLAPQLSQLSGSRACCTQAMLYPASVLPMMMEHLLVNNGLNKDLAIHNFSLTHSIPGYQLEPNLFWHTGMMTSLSNIPKDPEEFLFNVDDSVFSPG